MRIIKDVLHLAHTSQKKFRWSDLPCTVSKIYIHDCPNLEEIDLGVMDDLVELCITRCPRLTGLYITRANRLKKAIITHTGLSFSRKSFTNTTVEYLNLSNNDVVNLGSAGGYLKTLVVRNVKSLSLPHPDSEQRVVEINAAHSNLIRIPFWQAYKELKFLNLYETRDDLKGKSNTWPRTLISAVIPLNAVVPERIADSNLMVIRG